MQETVELRLRQRIRPFLFNRVLRGEDEKRIWQRVTMSAGRDLPLLHRLRACCSRLRRRAVDLVGEQYVCKDRAADETKSATGNLPLVDHLRSGDVGRHQVGRELDAGELQREALRERADQQRLGQPRHAFEDAVAAGEQADEELFDDLLLPNDGARDLFVDAVASRTQPGQVFHVRVGGGQVLSAVGQVH